MPFKCFNCPSKQAGPHKLHKAPLSVKLRNLWLNVMPNMKASDLDKNNFKLCILHFDEQYLTTGGILTKDAVEISSHRCFSMCIIELGEMEPPLNMLTEIQNVMTPSASKVVKSPVNTSHSENIENISPIASTSTMEISPERPASSGLVSHNFRYTGDIHFDVDYTPRTSKRALQKFNEKLVKYKRSNLILKKRLNREQSKLKDLNKFLDDLYEDGIITSASRKNLNEAPEEDSFIKELKEGKKDGQYSPKLRQFVMTMSFFSISGYEHLRQYLARDQIELPHVRTIRRWLQNVEGGPGITSQAVELIRSKIQSEEQEIYFSLIMDEMSIKQSKDWDNKNGVVLGYVDYGASAYDDYDNYDHEILASNVLVFFLCAINLNFKVPVAYFFIKSLTGSERAHVVQFIISHLREECNAKIISLTFDGLKANFSSASILGANLPEQPYFYVEPVNENFLFFLIIVIY